MKPRDPLAMMIDAACKPVDPNAAVEPTRCDLCDRTEEEGCRCWIRLRCETCNDTTYARREPDDGDADELVTLCPDCAPPPST